MWRILHPDTFCLSVSFHLMLSLSSRSTLRVSHIDVTWVSWQDSEWTLIKRGDRLLAAAFVYPAVQTTAEVRCRKQRGDQCQIQSEAFYHTASITGDCYWVILQSYLIESQSNHLLKVITIPLRQPGVCELWVRIFNCIESSGQFIRVRLSWGLMVGVIWQIGKVNLYFLTPVGKFQHRREQRSTTLHFPMPDLC